MPVPVHLIFRRPVLSLPVHEERPVVRSLSAKDDAILRAIGRYAYLKIPQLARLVPNAERTRASSVREPKRPEPERYLRSRCLVLFEQEYLRRRYLPQDQTRGKPHAVYWLGAKGRDYLDSLDVPSVVPPKPSEVETASYRHLLHHLTSNDLLISAELLTRSRPEIWIARMLPHRPLNMDPVRVSLPDGTKTTVKPDGWVHFCFGPPDTLSHQCIAFELDNGTEYQADWKDKLRRLLAYASGPYQEWSGTKSLLIAVAATPGEKRVQQQLVWTEALLRETKREAWRHLFAFAGVDPGTLPPDQLYLSPIWQRPVSRERVPLLVPPKGGG